MNDIDIILSSLEKALLERLNQHFHGKIPLSFEDEKISMGTDSPISRLISHYHLDVEKVLMLALALVPHVSPGFLDKKIQQFLPHGGDFPEFGGIKNDTSRGLLPTGETLLFLLAGNDIGSRLGYFNLFGPENPLVKHKVIYLEGVPPGDPKTRGKLCLDPEFVEVLTTGRVSLPTFGTNFPAERLQSTLDWEDMVLPEHVWEQITELQIWLRHKDELYQTWQIGRKLKPGFKALFYGPPGTGKTATVALIGKNTGKEVFRIDLSMVVSKYIGETEKNLAHLFDKAENKDWILFFDEADAIFGKRTGVRDAHDKYANQEVSYLLQRIESYNGLVILASNFKSNIDAAFVRRFNSIIYFPPPKSQDRLEIWRKSMPRELESSADIRWEDIADRYELTGSHIINIIQYLSLVSLESRDFVLTRDLLVRGIKRELEKEGK